MSRIRLVTFDVTNTIIRVTKSVGQNYANVARMYGKDVDVTKLNTSFRAVFSNYNKLYPNFGVHNGLTPFKWWSKVVVDSFREAGSDEQHLEQIAQHLYVMFATSKGWEVLPGAEKTLTELKQKGVKLGVISNFDDRLDKILTELALRHYFDFVLASAVVKIAKPDPDLFEMAFKMADVKPEEALHIGDNILTDYVGARNSGCKGVLLVPPDKQIPKDVDSSCVIRNLYQLTDYFKT
ncbi:haloacid dehalogenase-like hydrolase domain-containing protein 3 [Mercenaria mercenaria]|uniref:haloacid dehalogenase-like hydrolase domain-containing protein 3 n=1 Tax=Mercenaria mercenaria TaxID=6596 RepID=UPI00234E437D|nr:haloacid dehalogenase-like hydrolase domain-containing protein 3 [Mercenaria mercenaria]